MLKLEGNLAWKSIDPLFQIQHLLGHCRGPIFSLSLDMISSGDFNRLSLPKKINMLYERGTFVMAIRYYNYKINLYLLGNIYLEVFVNHKQSCIEKIQQLDMNHSRMKFYSDQIKLPEII